MQRKGPLPGKICARCILRRRFAGLFGYMARISCQSQLISDAWRANLARKGRFSRPRPLLGYMERKTCHGLPPGNAPRRNLATASRPRTHFAHILPSPGAWERIVSISCHRQTSENAQRRHTATASRPVAQRSPREGVGSGPWLCCGVRRATLSLREGVGIPPSRGLTAGNDFESALFRWATMSPLRVLQSCAVLCAEAKSALPFI